MGKLRPQQSAFQEARIPVTGRFWQTQLHARPRDAHA